MQSSHPFSLVLPFKDNIDLVASLAANGTTADPTGAVKLINGNVECTSCHNPARPGQRPRVAEFSGERQLKRPAVPGLPRSHPADGRPGQSAGRLVHQRARPIHRAKSRLRPCSEVTPRWLPMPAFPATPRTTPPARRGCCAARMNRTALPATTAARTSLPWRLTPTCLPSTPRPRSAIRFPPRPIRTTPPRARC